MKGYVRQRRGRFYAVVYEGRDPVTGKERRSWHPAGTDRAEAERLAAKLAAEETGRVDAVRSLTFGAYLASQWLPAKKLHLATSTYRATSATSSVTYSPPLAVCRCGDSAISRSKRSTTGCCILPKAAASRRRPCTQSTSSSGVRWLTPNVEGSSPATSPSWRGHHDSGPYNGLKASR